MNECFLMVQHQPSYKLSGLLKMLYDPAGTNNDNNQQYIK